MENLINKIEAKLIELGIVKLAEATSGATSGVTVTEAAPAVVVAEIVPNPIKISYSAIGAPVFSTDAEGVETQVEDGEYLLANNKKIVITAGKLESEIMVEEVEDIISGTTEMSTQTTEVLSEADIQMAIKVRSALQNIDITKSGTYYISLEVDKDLNVTYATMSSSTYETLMSEQETKLDAEVTKLSTAYETKLAEEKAKYESIIEGLKSGEVQQSQSTPEVPIKLSKAQVLKQQLMEKAKS